MEKAKSALRRAAALLAALCLAASMTLPVYAEGAEAADTTAIAVQDDTIETPTPEGNTTEPQDAEATPTPEPTAEPTAEPTITPEPTAEPAAEPTITPEITAEPTAEPTITPEPTHTPEPTVTPTPDEDEAGFLNEDDSADDRMLTAGNAKESDIALCADDSAVPQGTKYTFYFAPPKGWGTGTITCSFMRGNDNRPKPSKDHEVRETTAQLITDKTTDGRLIYQVDVYHDDQDKDNSLCPYGGFVWVKFTLDNDHWVTMKGQGNEGNQWIKIEDIANKCLDGNKLAESSGGNTQSKAYDYDITKWVDYTSITPKHVRYGGETMTLLNNSGKTLDSVTVTFWEKNDQNILKQVGTSQTINGLQTGVQANIEIPKDACAYVSFQKSDGEGNTTYIGGKQYFNFYNDEEPSDKIAVFPYDPVTRYCLIYTGDNDVRWSAPGSKTVYFDATFSDMSYNHDDAAKITYGMPDANGNLWCYITSEDGGKPAITSRMARDGTSEIWYVDVPEGYTKIRFASWEVDNTNTADNGTGTDLLTIPDLNKPCFYADTSDDVIYQGGNRDGYWDELGKTRDAETGKKQKKQTVVDIKEKEFKNISGVKYISSTLYDYYTDYELNGNNRDDYDTMTHGEPFKQQRNWVTFRQFNRTISDYYNAAANKPNYPIYTGHFQSDEEGVWPPFSNLAGTLNLYGWDYKDKNGNVAYRKFMATNNSKLDAQPNGPVFENGKGKYSYTMLGLVADQLSGGTANGDLLMSGTSLLEPHFNEAFLKGGNSRNAKIGEVYHDVLFPFTKNPNVFDDQDGVEYWWFDSSKTSLYMRQDPNKGYYLGNKNTDEGKKSENYTDNHSQNVNAVSGTNNVSTTYGFFPFNETADAASAEKYNYGFGAKLVIPFSLTANGQVQNKQGENKPIRFYFSGDDDVWVYIDGKLALDIGGAHGKVSGILDFGDADKDGKVKVYVSRVKKNAEPDSRSYGDQNDDTGDDTGKGKKLSIRYVGDSVDTDYYYSTSVNIPNLTTGTHTLTMFYMERGMWESNMAVAYNFPDYNELQVEKEVKVDKVDKDFQKFFTDDSLRLFSVDIRNQATHFPAKDVTGSGSTSAAQTVTAFTSYRMKNGTNDDNNYLKKDYPQGQNETENKTTVHWYAAEDDRGGSIDGKPCSSYRNSRYGQIELETPLNISNMDTLTFQVYAPSENKNADPVSVEYLYLELEDENGKVVGCKGGETRDEAANTYLKDKVQGNASMPDNTWSMLKIDLTTWDTARLQNVKYIRVGYDYARNIYFRNFTFSRSVVTTKAGFTTKQYDIPDYGTAENGGLAIPVGAQYTSNNKGDGGKTYAIGEDGQFDLANGEIVSFKDQFRRGSYISLREDTADSLFDTRWEIYENDRPVQGMGTGKTVENKVNGTEAPNPLAGDNVAPDDSRAEVYMTDSVDGVPQANKGYTATQKPEGANTIVFRSYTTPDDTDQFTKLRVKFINTVKVGSLSITKLQPEGETYLNGKTFDFTIVFDNIGGLGLGGDEPVVKHVKGVEVGKTVTLEGIPAGTHFTITEDAKPGSFLKGAKRNGSPVNGSVVEGTIAADDTVTAEFTNTARELFDITLDKQWLNADDKPLAHDGLPNVWVQLQRREGDSSEWLAVDGYNEVELTHSGQTDKWTATITALDKYADPETKKKPYTYRVVEYSVDKSGKKTLADGSGVLLGDYKYDPSYIYKSPEGATLPDDGITGGGSITITNTRQKPKYQLEITKQGIDGENEPVPLGGVEFTLEKLDDNNVYQSVGKKQATGTDGKCSFTELSPGEYRLTEVKTADGYTLLAEPIEFVLTDKGKCTHDNAEFGTVKRDAESGVYTIALTINNRKGLTLPHTGADAPSLWVLIGLPLLVAGLLVLVFRYNRKGGKRS